MLQRGISSMGLVKQWSVVSGQREGRSRFADFQMCMWGSKLQDVQYAVALAVMALVERTWSSSDERVDAMVLSREMKSDVGGGEGVSKG